MDQRTKAVLLRAFHYATEPFLLPNAWDVASARILEEARFAAMATTSAGIAFSCGYPDGQHIPLSLMIETVRRICDAVSVPVTADMEAGYGSTPEEVERMTELVLEAGAVGLNLQDGTDNPDCPLTELSLQLEKLVGFLVTAVMSILLLTLPIYADGQTLLNVNGNTA